MEKQTKIRKPWALLFVSLFSLIGLVSLIFSFPPSSSFVLLSIHISYLFPFFFLMFLFLYCLTAFFLKSAEQGLLIASTICLFLFFRMSGLTQPLFLILLLILFLCIEVVVWKKQ